jgi:catechol 2,3-dioxygenase-like lactoylglutathione lyase family enzyme
MAAKKKARAEAVSAKRKSKAKATPRTKVVKTSGTKAAKARALKVRKSPETLRIRAFMPSITVNDLQKSLAFYVGGLGFIEGERWIEADVLRGVMLKAGTSEFGISQDDWKLGRDRRKGVGFRIFFSIAQDIDALARRVKAAGFTLNEEVADRPEWRVRSFSLDDPDGFHITVTRDL